MSAFLDESNLIFCHFIGFQYLSTILAKMSVVSIFTAIDFSDEKSLDFSIEKEDG